MAIDFSILKNIDLTNRENLLFLSIIFVLAVILFWAFLFITAEFIKGIKRLIMMTFNIDAKKPKFNQKNNTDWLRDKIQNKKAPSDVSSAKNTGADFIKNFYPGGKKFEEKEDIEKIKKEKIEKDISDKLSALKSSSSAGEDTLESKMPSMSESRLEDSEEIKIPIPRHFSTSNMQLADSIRAQGASGIVRSDNKIPSQKIKENKNIDQSIFEGKPEVSRRELAYEMRTDPNIWESSREAGLNLSPAEREKLVKEVFSSALGSNISKMDLKWAVKKLNQKMVSAKNPAEHAKLRKEIKFFKKIGGIKGNI